MNASMLLVTTAWIAGADIVPAGCASCSAPAPAPVVVAAPVSTDCGCEASPCGSSKHAGLLTKLKGMFASKGGKHHKGGCGACGEPAPACDSCGGAAPAPAPVVGAPAASIPPSVMPAPVPAAPVANPEPKAMPKPADPATPRVQAPKVDGMFAIPQAVTPVSAEPKGPTLGTPANPF